MKALPPQDAFAPANKGIPERQTITSSLKFIVVLGQCFSLLPIGTSRLSLKTIYSLLVMAGTFFMSFMGVYHCLLVGFSLGVLISNVFFAAASLTVLLFLSLAKNWSKLIGAWMRVDKRMEKVYGYPKNLTRYLKLLTLIIMVLATIEHLCSLMFQIVVLNYRYNTTISFEQHYKIKFAQVFDHIEYSVSLALLVQVITLFATFMWTYCDLFIIILSTALVARFKQITRRLLASEIVRFQDMLWIELRKDYDQLCHLCSLLNQHLSRIVLLSYVMNLFFLLVQLGIVTNTMENIYYTYSFIFLVVRTVAVSLFAAKINDESKEPIAILNSVPSSVYNVEVQRLLLQMSFDNVALTGCNLFKITRGLILNIAGAIVTYELVIIQFSEANDDD